MYYDQISAFAKRVRRCNYINWRIYKETKNLCPKTGRGIERYFFKLKGHQLALPNIFTMTGTKTEGRQLRT